MTTPRVSTIPTEHLPRLAAEAQEAANKLQAQAAAAQRLAARLRKEIHNRKKGHP